MKNLQPKGRLFFKMNGSWRKLVTVHTQHSLTWKVRMHAYCTEYEKSSGSFFFDKR